MPVSWLILVVLSVAAGFLIHFALRRFSNQAALREVKRRKKAWFYELRLFVDEPALIGRAQLALLKDNLRHLGILSRPLIVIVPAVFLIYVVLDGMHGQRPLTPGHPATLTVHLAPPVPEDTPQLELPEGMAVETPPVRIPAKNEVSWRIRPTREISGTVRIRLAGETVEQRVWSGTDPVFVMGWPVGGKRIRSVEIPYPDAGWGWLIWFTVISLVAVLLLNRRFGVSL